MGSPGDHLDDEQVSDEPGRPASATWLRVAAVVPAILLMFVVGRAWLSDDNPVHADGEGILSAQPGPGAVAFARPTGKGEFWGTFGTYFLCLDEDADDVELTGFRYESTTAPRDLYLGIRTLTPRQVEVNTRGDATISAAGSTRGQPPQFRVHGRTNPLVGSFRRGIGGVAVETGCDSVPDFGSRTMAAPTQELLVVARAGAQGAYVTDLEIDYEADGRSYTLRLDTDLAFCGSRVTVCDSA